MVREKATTSSNKVPGIVAPILAEANVLVSIPSTKSLVDIGYRARKKVNPTPPNPKSLDEFVVPEALKNHKGGEFD
jgi:hypothetical protein